MYTFKSAYDRLSVAGRLFAKTGDDNNKSVLDVVKKSELVISKLTDVYYESCTDKRIAHCERHTNKSYFVAISETQCKIPLYLT